MGKGKLVALLVAVLVTVGALWGTILSLRLEPQLGLDLQGGVSAILIPVQGQGAVDEDVLDQTVSNIRQRVDALGVAEPEITRQGNTIQVQLPGIADQEQAREVIGRTAQLQFRPVLEALGPAEARAGEPEPAAGAADPGLGAVDASGPCDLEQPRDQEVVLCLRPDPEPGQAETTVPVSEWTRLRLGPAEVVGTDLADAQAAPEQSGLGNWVVELTLTDQGAGKFKEITGRLACEPFGAPARQLGIVLDNIVESAPPIGADVPCNQGIDQNAIITVGGGQREAKNLAAILRAGALPIPLEFGTFQSVSPTLGSSSLQAGLAAGAIGLALVAAYMIALYRGIGVATITELAVFGLVVYGTLIVLGSLAGFTLTLAGIAGIIVSIGIAADSSIIYRERYRDELRAGRTVRTAADTAFSRALRTNLTGNTVSFLAAAVLYLLAVGPVRGFAFTLGLSTLIDTLVFATYTRAAFGLIARSPRLASSRFMGLRAGVVHASNGATKRPPTSAKV
ncbi:MAG: protein translocase subunit SecD [Egibacteraceae bacterium]